MYFLEILIFIVLACLIISTTWGTIASPSGQIVGGKNCQDCENDFNWYESLKRSKKIVFAAWWAARKAACSLKGC
jgi:hypothetical protein